LRADKEKQIYPLGTDPAAVSFFNSWLLINSLPVTVEPLAIYKLYGFAEGHGCRSYELLIAIVDLIIRNLMENNVGGSAWIPKVIQGTLYTTELLLNFDITAGDRSYKQNLKMESDLYNKLTHSSIDVVRLWTGIGVICKENVVASRCLLMWDERCSSYHGHATPKSPREDVDEMGVARERAQQTYYMLAVWQGPP